MIGDLPAEFQGVGTYSYECEYPDCWFCEIMKIKHGGSGKRVYQLGIGFNKNTFTFWSPEDTKKLYLLRDQPIKVIVQSFNGRTREAIMNKRWSINKKLKNTNKPELQTI